MESKTIKFLLVSNGYGEDNIAAHIGSKLLELNSSSKVYGFPTVGDGKFYRENNIPLLGRGLSMPSEGFVRSIGLLLADLSSGLVRKTILMGRELKNASKIADILIIVGDPYLLRYTSFFTPHPGERKIFTGVQQSEWYGTKKPFKQHYSMIERIWMKKFSGLIFVRDEKTALFLKKKGLKHTFSMGNPMMDCFNIHREKIFRKKTFAEYYKNIFNDLFNNNGEIIGILPGSKREAYDNLKVIFNILKQLSRLKNNQLYIFALSPNLDMDKIILEHHLIVYNNKVSSENGIIRVCTSPEIQGPVILTKGLFGDVINEANLIIGVSGTGNEQAAGMGKPIVGFWGKGPQITKKFMKAQKKLLGDALFLYPPDPELIAKEIVKILDSPKLQRKAKEAGKERMWGRGSIEKICKKILEYSKKILT